ncbi:MAG: SDR family oxidoreductase [Thermoguttaceae bacterium]|nr:SDR family oxidoreductase [Thermoguttaceae bacterium]MDW8038032.1 SDR family oxidoreductase [Thermoguttaceae bacterium]
MQLSNKVALVTGGSSGIGLAIAKALAQEGCRVAIAARDPEKLRHAAESYQGQPPLVWHACDVANRQAVDTLFRWLEKTLGPVDILVNSAGINIRRRTVAELDPADWDQVIAVNLSGAFYCIWAALPYMRTKGEGLIINISSISGKRALKYSGVAYCASKFGMTALGTCVGIEEWAHGIRVTNIYPGEVDTPILEQRPTPVPPERRAQMLKPEDVAACVLWVAKLPRHVLVPELVVTPLYQEYV